MHPRMRIAPVAAVLLLVSGCTSPGTDAPSRCIGIDCAGKGTCVEGAGGPVCVCQPGFSAEGTACVAVEAVADPCAGVGCGGHGVCGVVQGVPRCFCDAGFAGQGTACEAVADPCAGIGCDDHGACVATAAGKPLCVCEVGFAAKGSGCVPVEAPEIACEGVTCSGHGACVPTTTGPACLCERGFYWKGAECLANVDPCANGGACGANGACVVTPDGPACLCLPGFVSQGAACVPDEDPCAVVTCSDQGACIEVGGAPACLCAPGFHAQGVDCVADGDPCAGVDCTGHGACVVSSQGAKCLCDPGYYAAGIACLEQPLGAVPASALSDLALVVDDTETGTRYVGNEVLVFAAEGHDATVVGEAVAGAGATVAAYLPGIRMYTIRLAAGAPAPALDALVATLGKVPGVGLAARNYVLSSAKSPSDGWDDAWSPAPGGDNWYLELISAQAAWSVSTGTGGTPVKVGVIDGDFTVHDDLTQSLVASWPVQTDDTNEHGTHVSGLITAQGDNGSGLTGVLWRSSLYYCQWRTGGTTEDSESRWFTCMEWLVNEAKARVINLSAAACWKEDCAYDGDWAEPGVTDDPVKYADWLAERRDAITSALKPLLPSKWLLVQATGNEGLANGLMACGALRIEDPELAERVIAVGAVGPDAKQTVYSNRGGHILAPGGEPGFFGTTMTFLAGHDDTDDGWGTSYAAPLVAGTAALIWYAKEDLEPEEVRDLLLTSYTMTADDTPILSAGLALGYVSDLCEVGGGAMSPTTGKCIQPECTCDGKQCGDDGCGGTCNGIANGDSDCQGSVATACQGTVIVTKDCLLSGATCEIVGGKAACVSASSPCVANCAPKDPCGPDGCGGSCGACDPSTTTCSAGGACVAYADAPPKGDIASPADGSAVTGPFSVAATASDDAGLAKVSVVITGPTGVQMGKDSVYPGAKSVTFQTKSFDPAGWAAGTYTIGLWALDSANPAIAVDAVNVAWAAGPCVPKCAGKECGADGCGGTCAPGCGAGEGCSGSGLCGPEGMVLVPAGPFKMGAGIEPCSETEDYCPIHDVTLDAFYVDVTEVTVLDFKLCQAQGPCTTPWNHIGCNWGKEDKDEHPIECVDWYQADTFCKSLDKRLCTEAEWEKAATGGGEINYPWGDEEPKCDHAVAGYCAGETAPVGSKPKGASPFGVLDLSGNVSEWVSDWYQADYYANSPVNNPSGPDGGTFRVVRGGSFDFKMNYYYGSIYMSTFFRWNQDPSSDGLFLGFRCCKSVP